MNQKLRNCIIVPAVCLSMLTSAPANVLAARFDDAEIHWAKDAIEVWAGHEVVQGFGSMFRPDDAITRGEMAVMVNRMMNYQEKAENTFEDLTDTWYTDAVLKLVKQEVMVGYDNKIRPEDPITREEALVILARALGVKDSNTRSSSFIDMNTFSDWASGAINAMAERGFINGYEDGSFRPQESMTRACSVTVINNAVKGFYNKPGTYQAEGEIDGIVIVNTADVVLEGMTINGDLLVTPGVKDGVVTLKGTTVSGEQIIMGGSVNEVEPGTPTPTPPPTNPDNGSGGSGGSGGGSGGSGGGSTIQTAAATDIIVNSSYADKTGTVTFDRKRYTIGKNAFSTLEEAAAQAQTLEQKASITLLSDLNLDATVAILSDNLTLDGNGHALTFAQGVKDGIQVIQKQGVLIQDLSIHMQDEAEKWNGSYGIQAYQSTVTLKDVSATGADAGILVNGAEVALEGVVDVSGNEFGGIEVSKGQLAEKQPKLTGTAANLKNDTEQESGKPTIWIDKVSELTTAVVEVSGLREVPADKDQMYYFLYEEQKENTASVGTLEELEAALINPDIEVINIVEDIESNKTLDINRAVVITGLNGSKNISFDNKDGIQVINAGTLHLENINIKVTGDEEGWQGLYALQVYGASNVTLKDVSATGADAGILVNGAEVALEGVVDVSGNEFGGIEVSKGQLAETQPKLTGTAANLKNDTEQETGKPTIWIDKVSELTTAVVEVSGLREVSADNDQMYYFLYEEQKENTASVGTLEDLEAALINPDIAVIYLTGNIVSDKTLQVNRAVTITGQDGMKNISFDNKNGIQVVNAGAVKLENVKIEVTGDEEGWQGLYALQVYGASNATLKDVSATGADAGILVNGAEVTLEGVVDVSGNEFGGIEVSKGLLAETQPKLTGTAANLKNDTEQETENPTVWIDKVSELTTAVVEVSGLREASVEKDQVYFFLNQASENR